MVLHHLHTRKRISGHTKHPFPANSRLLRLLDKVVYAAGIIAIIMMFPQLRLIYIEKSADGLAPITWVMLAILNIPWIIYGFAHREKPIVLVYCLWLIVNSLMFIGALLY